MIADVAIILGGLVALAVGAESLVRGASALARRLGLTPLVVGLTVVAFGTSLPEGVVSVQAAAGGQGAVALGNVVGSNIFNTGVILGLVALLQPLGVSLAVLRRDAPVVVAVSILLAATLLLPVVGRGLGVASLLALAGYTAWNVRLARREAMAAPAAAFDAGLPGPSRRPWRDLLLVVAGLALLVLGGRLLVDGAIALARSLAVSERVIALTVVAAGTSLPELATSVVAAVRRQAELAVGNILGSNVFNVLGILGAAAVVRPVPTAAVAWLDVGVMTLLAVVLWPLLWTGRRLQRMEGLLLLAIAAAHLAALLAGVGDAPR